jgi:hypothetical protein
MSSVTRFAVNTAVVEELTREVLGCALRDENPATAVSACLFAAWVLTRGAVVTYEEYEETLAVIQEVNALMLLRAVPTVGPPN